jgi:Rrf2 family protein
MLRLSKKVDYGLILLSRLAQRSETASAREMAAKYDLPPSMIANVLKALTGAGLLVSTRGAQGGYELARPAGRISLAEIVEALEGPFSLVDCVGGEVSCRYSEVCPTHDPIRVVHQRFQDFMATLTLADIVGDARIGTLQTADGHEKTHLPG